MSKISKACDISPAVRNEIHNRDKVCIICGSSNSLQIAHFISRGRLGLGIPQNLGLMCANCHYEYDNGKFHNEIKSLFTEHLKAHYPEWNEKDLIYSKWRYFNGNSQ